MKTSNSYVSALLTFVLLVSAMSASATPEKTRIWTSKEGVTIKGGIKGFEGENVVLRDGNGEEYRVPPSALIEEDQKFIAAWKKKQKELDRDFEAPGKRKTPEKVKLRLCRIALDISYNCFENTFDGSMKKTDAAVERIINELNRAWLPEAGIKYEIGNLEVRTDKETDPYQATRAPGEQLGIARKVNGKHRCDIVFVLCANADHGGGLGGGRAVWAAWGGDAWDLMHHEFSHAFGTGHGHGWSFELGTMNQKSQGSRYPRERRHTFNFKEVEIIREHSKNLKEIGFAEEKVPPYATLDELHFKKQRASSRLGAKKGLDYILDPLANDYDLNGEEVFLKGVEKRSVRGAKLTKLKDGRIRYQRDEEFSDYIDYDFFHYEIEDEGGLKSRGAVAMFFDQAERIVKNGEFSEGRKGWKMNNAEIVDNGEAITSIPVDKRGLIQPGGEIIQEVELEKSLSDKYVLEATIYCGPERDSSGNTVNPASKPELIVGIYSDRDEVKRRVDEHDITIELPFQLKTNTLGGHEVRFTNVGEVPVRVGHVILRPVD